MMNWLKDAKVGRVRGRRAPIDIGTPTAVVFLMRKGIGLASLTKSSTELREVLANRSGTTTFGLRDSVVIVLKTNDLK